MIAWDAGVMWSLRVGAPFGSNPASGDVRTATRRGLLWEVRRCSSRRGM